MIHIAYSTSNLYAKFAGTSMLSVFENTRADVTVHIFHDSTFTNDNRDKFSYIAGHYNQRVIFYNAEEICAEEINTLKNKISTEVIKRCSIPSTFRILAGKIIPRHIDKIIYLDSDTIVNLDITELWSVEPGEKPLAAVLNNYENLDINRSHILICRDGFVKGEDYFNSGVMVMNLHQMLDNLEKIWGGWNL